MSIPKRTRDEYEEGLRDRNKDLFDQVVTDVSGNHPDSDAYYKGRSGEQLDGGKNEDDEE